MQNSLEYRPSIPKSQRLTINGHCNNTKSKNLEKKEPENDDNDMPNEEDENQKDKSDDININKIKISTINRDSSIDKPKLERHKTDKVNIINEENINFETQLNGN